MDIQAPDDESPPGRRNRVIFRPEITLGVAIQICVLLVIALGWLFTNASRIDNVDSKVTALDVKVSAGFADVPRQIATGLAAYSVASADMERRVGRMEAQQTGAFNRLNAIETAVAGLSSTVSALQASVGNITDASKRNLGATR